MNWRPDPEFLRHALIVLAGHRYWLLPFLPLLWLVFQGLIILYDPTSVVAASSVQGQLLAAPLTALAIFLGMRIIAGEIDDRTLEIAYTVPGGCERLWFVKLTSAFLLLLAGELVLAIVVYLCFTPFPVGALYGALQGACFYLVLSMAMGTLFRSEASGAIATIAILAINLLFTDYGNNQLRFSPFFNPYFLADPGAASVGARNLGFTSATELLAWTIQNRIGMLLVMAALMALAFMRANRRERMLDGM
ncbi:MAG TPA: hypothetical protein QF517_07165 [Pseudomonadales bacterium]|jgi:ABC-type transport system involved in multi-copper enzyme maturation permease subunit|nr:hypothetical protein [Pseudomonadales bacterium]MDP6314691.1 hypothetical protein [Pseudomonadales bacterium]MDP7313254.1 hypothetical protein [Pseudomonadales bacterium]HJL61723.1 hypothetical protein [Pseudomonadales bacterium]HJP51206.1 hypothetical protein [Pseudomonadales bacterium]|tara:strand:- start:20613 stop:21359 length:747 start_codon:yes stop_codon:yes gene_type:complete